MSRVVAERWERGNFFTICELDLCLSRFLSILLTVNNFVFFKSHSTELRPFGDLLECQKEA